MLILKSQITLYYIKPSIVKIIGRCLYTNKSKTYKALVESRWQSKTEVPGETPVPLTLWPSQITHGLSEVSPRTTFVFPTWKKIKITFLKRNLFSLSMGRVPLLGQSLLVVLASRSHSDTPQSLGLLWTSDRPHADLYLHNTTLTTDTHPCHRPDSNPRSQQASCRRPMPQTARQVGPAKIDHSLYNTDS